MRNLYVRYVLTLLFFASTVNAQVGIGTATPDPSAMLDIVATNKGILIPRVALTGTGDNTTVPTPQISLLIYNTTAAGSGTTAVVPGFYYWNGTSWVNFVINTLQQNINTNKNWLSGDGTSSGLYLDSNGIALAKGTFGTGSDLTEVGGGSKLIWYPKKAAFRAGYVGESQWDNTNIGPYSTAFGYNTTASGFASTAMGAFVSTNNQAGSFAIGDYSTNTINNNDAPNQMMMRFANGYKFYTNAETSIGVQVTPGGNAWTTISDVRKKENFAPIDGEAFLSKISKFNLVSWNYKGQDMKHFRHYGPMAQDFYKAFGKDTYGTIGNDTTINQADFDGINLIAIQALEKRTTELKKENEQLKQQLVKVATVEKENGELKQNLAQLQSAFEAQQKLVAKRLQQLEATVAKQGAKEPVAVK